MKSRKMDIPEPIYQWLLRLKAELSAVRGRNVTYPEVWEYLKFESERTAMLLADAKMAKARGGEIE